MADITQHIHAPELIQTVRYGSEALRMDQHVGNFNFIALTIENELLLIGCTHVAAKGLFLTGSPVQRQPRKPNASP